MRSLPFKPHRQIAVVLFGVMLLGISVFILRSSGDEARQPPVNAGEPEYAKPAKPILTKVSPAMAAVELSSAPQRWLYLTDHDIRAEVHEIASERSAKTLSEDIVNRIGDARAQLTDATGSVWWVVRPLAWRVDHYNHEQATVSVWLVSVLSATGVAIPQSEWRTATLDLVWNGHRWLLDAERSTPGPTPATGSTDEPWNSEPFDRALKGFTRLGPVVSQ